MSHYVRLFVEGGLDQLLSRNKAPQYKPPYLSLAEQEELTAIISEQTPYDLGFTQEAYWNTKLIQELLMDRFDVGMTREGIRMMLRRLGFRYTRPTYVLVKADKQKQENFEQELDMIKKVMTDSCVLLYEDESHIRDVQTLHATWQPKGKQKQVPVSGSQTTLHLFGAVNPEKGSVYCMEADRCNAQTF